MKRKTFLQTSIAAGLGFSLMPQLVFAGKKSMRVFELPSCTGQVRHGNLYAELNKPGLKSGSDWLLNFERHVFLKNGFNPSDEDLQHFSILLEGQNEPVNFAIARNEVLHFQNNRVEKKKLPATELTEIFQDENYSVRIGSGESNSSTVFEGSATEKILVNLAPGNILFNNEIIQENQGAFCTGFTPLSVKPLNGNPFFVCIEKKA